MQARTPPIPSLPPSLSTRSSRTRSARTLPADESLTQRPAPPTFSHRPTSLSTVFNAAQAQVASVRGTVAVAGPAPPSRQAAKRELDVLDLTQTTDDADAVPGSQPKRARKVLQGLLSPLVPAAATTAARDVTAAADAQSKKLERLEADVIAWRQKYREAFPSFVFYFDHIDDATKRGLTRQVERLGSTVDNFFSKKVTHVVTTRSVPGPSNKENLASPGRQTFPQSLAASANITSAAGPSRTKRAARPSAAGYLSLDGQKLRQYGDVYEKNPFIDHQDILSKASEFGLKIWRLDKIQYMLSRIYSKSPVKADARRKLSLPSLLRDEQLFGTRERDPFVPRPDMHYFNTATHRYLLVEDSTGEHRPIAAMEYEKPRKGQDPSWPVLWGGPEGGRHAFYHYTGPPIVHENRLKRPEPVEEDDEKLEDDELVEELPEPAAEPFKGHAAFAARAVAPSLRRTASLNRLTTLQPPEKKTSYLAASGNSQTITSTVASATSTRSGVPLGGALGNGPLVNRRLADLSRNTVPTRFGGQSAKPKLKRSTSVDAGLNARAPPLREEPKKPGYCESCRCKYDDIKAHVLGRKHRKFARDPENWIQLDLLLASIKRPLVYPYSESSPVDEGDSGFFDQSCEDDEDQSDDADADADDFHGVGDEADVEE